MISNKVPTVEDVRQLLAATHSEERPAPYQHGGQQDDLIRSLYYDQAWPGQKNIVRLWTVPGTVPPWDSGAAIHLETYLYETHPEDEAEERFDALEEGADPTPDELAQYEKLFWEGEFYPPPVYTVVGIRDPDAPGVFTAQAESDPNVMYFVLEGIEQGQMSDLVEWAGPFRTLSEAALSLLGEPGSRFAFVLDGTMGFYDGLDQDATARFQSYLDFARNAGDNWRAIMSLATP